jgi:predicted Zn-dependent protease
MIGKDAALKMLHRLIQESPADQTEALLLTEDSSLARFNPTGIHQHVAERNRTLILRVVLGKRVAVVTTNILHSSSLKALMQKAIASAKIQPVNDAFVSLPGPKPIPTVNTLFKNIRRLTPGRKVKIIQEVMTRVQENGCMASGAFSHGEVELAVVNSLGVEAFQKFSDLFLHLVVQNEEGSGYASFVSRDWDQLRVEPLVKAAVAKACRGKPVQVEPGEYEVILEPQAVQELLAFLAHLGFHGLAVQEGRSFFCNQFGKKMVHEKVTIYDDGLDPQGLPVPFDFEGLPKQKVIFFEEGVAKNVTYDSFTAGREGKESTGHGLIPPNTEGPIPFNLFMQAGETHLEEMIRSMRRGIYVTRFHYTNVIDPMKAVITGMTRDGTFWVEEGEIKNPIKNLRFTESILKALSRLKAISRERKLCSSGSVYGRRFITGTVVPAIQVDGFNFSGVSSL